jgi:dTDP-4-amino-4,6-dideoxygalactose transaminase
MEFNNFINRPTFAEEMHVPLVDLKAQYHSMSKEIDDAMHKVIVDSAFIGGPYLKEFEKNFAVACGKKYCVGVSSGTSAIKLGLQALGIKRGDEVITSTHTFIATVEAISEAGAKPVLVDIEENTFNLNPDLVKKAITKKTKAIVPVHLYGQAAEVKRIKEIADAEKIVVLEDTAQSHLAKHYGKVLPYGDFGTFSFYPGKVLGAYGDAGAFVCNDEAVAERVRKLANHGRASGAKYLHDVEGFNHRMDGIQAAILDVKLKHLPTWNKRREEIANKYNNLLAKIQGVVTPKVMPYNTHIYHQYIIRVQKRDALLEFLKSKGIEAGIHYPVPMHLQPAYAYLGLKKGSFPVTEKIVNEIVSLPMFPEMTEEQIKFVADTIREFYAK